MSATDLFAPPCREEELLAPYAMRTALSRGRQSPEAEHPFRSPYQRDRDRVVYSTAFRRLAHKTQVLVTQTNDHHRTRLTHTLEVAQIARTLARRLRLNEDLTEAIALSHDLGHPPFGHAGEHALDDCMADHGGFEHNLHALRIVDLLEHPYPDRPGLNLSWEVREAMAQHSRRRDRVELNGFDPTAGVLLEAQTADAADSLAYVTHDVDDASSPA
ncbi:MAG: dNTP triphosphohydrolase [Gemmataceae bacterium]